MEWSVGRIEQLKKDRQNGLSSNVMAEKYGIEPNAVRTALWRQGLSTPRVTFWNYERITELKKLLAEGKTRGEIALLWGVTRNSVIGKCHRLELYGPKQPAKPKAPKLNRPPKGGGSLDRWRSKSRPAQQPRVKFEACPDEPDPRRISLLDLDQTHCHWLCEGTDDHCLPTYCGHPSVDGRWCAHHYRRVYQVRS